MPHPTPLAYRPDIDGLRAVAVASVVGYHAFPAYVPGGFVGVDVFFVISGYLISTILIGEISARQFSLWRFYARRIRRLFPALIVVLAATLLLGWYYLLPHEFVTLGKHTAAGAGYVINYVLSDEAGYFDAAAETKPLLHLWSLAVEEQYYLVWPILLLLLVKWKRPIAGIAAVALASFAANLIASSGSDSDAFFLPQNRVWELSIGALLAALNALPDHRVRLGTTTPASPRWGRLWSHAASVVGVGLVLFAITRFDDTMTFPGTAALVPCLGAAAIIAAGPEGVLNRQVMALRPMVLLGLISYPLYLWHWPLLAIPATLGLPRQATLAPAAVAIAIVLATGTYVFLERPARRRPTTTLALFLLAGTLGSGVVGLAVMTGQVPSRLDGAPFQQVGLAIDDWSYPDGLTATDDTKQMWGTTQSDQPGILFIGDSHMEQYWPRVALLLKREGSRAWVRFVTRGGCLPIADAAVKRRDQYDVDCLKQGTAAMSMAQRPEIGTVVIAANWRGYLGAATPAEQERIYAALAEMFRGLRAQGKTVWLILQLPSGRSLAPEWSVRRSLDGSVTLRSASLPRSKAESGWGAISDRLRAIAKAEGIRVIDPMDTLCDREVCRGALGDGTLMYKDSGHLRSSIAASQAVFIDRIFEPSQ